MMATKRWLEMTPQERVNEVGDEPDCPNCGKPRVTRSTYIRCIPCGLNWENGTDISRHPNARAVIAAATSVDASGAQTASAT